MTLYGDTLTSRFAVRIDTSLGRRSAGTVRACAAWLQQPHYPAATDAEAPFDYCRRISRLLLCANVYRALRKIAAFLNLCESDCHNRIRGCGYDGSSRFF